MKECVSERDDGEERHDGIKVEEESVVQVCVNRILFHMFIGYTTSWVVPCVEQSAFLF